MALTLPALAGCATHAVKFDQISRESRIEYGSHRDAVDFETLVAHPDAFDAKTVQLDGYLAIEPENRYFWKDAAGYGVNESPCAYVQTPDELYNHREALSRRKISLKAYVDSRSGVDVEVGRCDRIRLLNVELSSVNEVSYDVAVGEPALWYLTNDDAADNQELKGLADRVRRALTVDERDRGAAIAKLVPEQYSILVLKALGDPKSRISWILFNWADSFARLLKSGDVTRVDVLQDRSISAKGDTRGALCFCTKDKCVPQAITPTRIFYRASFDPYACLPVDRSNGEWRLNVGYLLGKPKEDEVEVATEP